MTEARAADGAGAPADLQSAMLGFVSELRTFRDGIQNRMKTQEDRMSMFDRKTALRGRSPLAIEANAEAPHQKAFAAYVRSGEEDGLRGLAIEQKAISVADGGFLMPNQVAENVQNALRANGSLRAVANVVQVESLTYDVLVETGDTGTAWSNDIAATAESANAGLQRISIPLNELSAMPKASQRLLDDAAFDVEAWLSDRIAERFGRAEAAAFITGNGTDKPKGVLSQATQALALAEDPKFVGYGETGLDYHYTAESAEIQQVSLRTHIEAARRTGLPLIIHARDADEDMARILTEEHRIGAYSCVMHCFTSGPELARAALDLGFYLSMSGIAAFPRSTELREIFAAAPHDRILVETDAPYLAPPPFRGKRNEPAYVAHTAKVGAQTLGLSEAEFARLTSANFDRLFARAAQA